jgi:hypothetical protein
MRALSVPGASIPSVESVGAGVATGETEFTKRWGWLMAFIGFYAWVYIRR